MRSLDKGVAVKISDYAMLSDCQTAALVSRDGSVDWYCPPRFDAASVFGRLLDPGAGYWRIAPLRPARTTRSYVDRSLVLRTVFETDDGSVELVDALVLGRGERRHEIGKDAPHILVRSVRGLSGSVTMSCEFEPRFEYGLTTPRAFEVDGGISAEAGPIRLTLHAPVGAVPQMHGEPVTFALSAGETAQFGLSFTHALHDPPPEPPDVRRLLGATRASWASWTQIHEGYKGVAPDLVRRSAVVLRGLTYQPSGAVTAAPTTSLPERPGEEWNWDYRYVWLRDLSLMVRAMWAATCPDEPTRFLKWIDHAGGVAEESAVQIMYGLEGERDLSEHTLGHLTGFANSRPVRVGNEAWGQRQVDVIGEVMDSAYLLGREIHMPVDDSLRDLLLRYADIATDAWREPDSGMWELRDRERHYLSSKVMCWVALDRALQMDDVLHAGEERRRRWAAARDEVRAAVLERGWSPRLGAFVRAWDDEQLDASVLIMPLFGFLDARDERMLSTIEAVERSLTTDGLVRRWAEEPNAFVMCSFWLVQCLALTGRIDEAHERFEHIAAFANDVGLLSEQIVPETGELVGNFPQALSHVGLINAARRLTEVSAAVAVR